MATTETKTGQHTPAPWDIVDTRDGIAIVVAKHLQIVVDHRENFGSSEPDACLISAAPELLEAAKCAAEAIKLDLPRLPRDWNWEGIYSELQAAIAKAEGR